MFPRYISQEIGSVNRFGSLDEEDEDPNFSTPPNAPPPPPPLNLPPSRARRQLAARLARHKQNQERELLSRQEEPSSQPGANAEFGQLEGGRFAIESDDGDADEFVPDVDVQPSLLSSFQRFFRSSGKPSPPSLLLSPSLNHPLFTPGSWSSLSSTETQSQSPSAATVSAPPGAQPPAEEDADLGIIKLQQPPPHEDEVDAFGGRAPAPQWHRTTESIRRELLEPEDGDDEYDGDVVDFGREKADEMEDEEEREDLIEIKPPRKGQLSLETPPPLPSSASGAEEKSTERSSTRGETASSSTTDSNVNCVTATPGHGEKQPAVPVEGVPAVSLSSPIREFSSF